VLGVSLPSGAGVRGVVWSFGPAARGVWIARREGNMKVHAVAALVVAGLGGAYAIAGTHLAIVATSVALVISLEIMDTAVERLCDLVVELHGLGTDGRVRDIKDLAAGAVLVAALGAAINGLVVFGPHLV
jgi:diacylglycerol kinase